MCYQQSEERGVYQVVSFRARSQIVRCLCQDAFRRPSRFLQAPSLLWLRFAAVPQRVLGSLRNALVDKTTVLTRAGKAGPYPDIRSSEPRFSGCSFQQLILTAQ